MAHTFKCYENSETQDLLPQECLEEMGLDVELEAHRGLLRQLHLGRQRKGRITGTKSQKRDSQNRIPL